MSGGWKVAVASILVVLSFGIAGTGVKSETAPAPRPHSVVAVAVPRELVHSLDHAVTVDAYGDSITTLTVLGIPRAQLSWINWLPSNDIYIGGYAESGKRSDEIAAGAVASRPVSDVAVIMAGTNDTRQNVPVSRSMIYLALIVKMVSESSHHVLVSLIAPSDGQPTQTTAYNAALVSLAAANGWETVDPWVTVRAADGRYLPGFSYDGTHPNGLGQRQSGAILGKAIFEAGNR